MDERKNRTNSQHKMGSEVFQKTLPDYFKI